jgi:hypothetical protein
MHGELLVHATPVVRKPEASQCRFIQDAAEHPLSSSRASQFRGNSKIQTARLNADDGTRCAYPAPAGSLLPCLVGARHGVPLPECTVLRFWEVETKEV